MISVSVQWMATVSQLNKHKDKNRIEAGHPPVNGISRDYQQGDTVPVGTQWSFTEDTVKVSRSPRHNDHPHWNYLPAARVSKWSRAVLRRALFIRPLLLLLFHLQYGHLSSQRSIALSLAAVCLTHICMTS